MTPLTPKTKTKNPKTKQKQQTSSSHKEDVFSRKNQYTKTYMTTQITYYTIEEIKISQPFPRNSEHNYPKEG